MAKEVRVPDYSPSDRQTKFHTSTAFETLYGGAAGGGKSAAIVAEAITYALEYPKARIYIFRKTIPELKQSIVPEIYKQCADFINLAKGMTYNAQDRVFNFTNGSMIQLAYLENIQDMFRYQSSEIHLLLIDELTHFTQEEYEYLKTRVRSTGEHPLKVMSATNPGNIGHAWVKAYFIDIAPPETVYTDSNGNTRQFIPAKVSDHPIEAFRDTYTRQLSSLTNPDLKRALLLGDWDIFAGQAFNEWKRDTEGGKPWHVVEPFPIPGHWVKWFAYDYGYNSFAAGLWLTRDPSTERIYIYREFYQHEMPVSKQAEMIQQNDNSEGIRLRLSDPSIWKQRGDVETGENIANIFQKSGLNFQPANNDRMAGKNAIHEMLAPAADGLPKMQVFSNCTNFIRTFPALPIDINRPEDIDCFVAGTMITTDKGEISVENIKDGDLLLTPSGYREAYKAGKPHKAISRTITLSTGKTLTGSAKHKIFVQGKGLVALADVGCNDILETWNTSQLRSMRPLLTKVWSLENIITNAITSRTAIISNLTATPISIGKFGKITMARFQRVIMSTIKTTIRAIMTLQTLSLYPKGNMLSYTTANELSQVSYQTNLNNGVLAMVAKPSYALTWRNVVKEAWNGNYRALAVASLLRHSVPPKSTAPKIVPIERGKRRTPNPVLFVKNLLSLRTSKLPKPVRITAVGNLEERIVYPLRVEQLHLYYANDILVTNTRAEDHLYDALRYGIINQRPGVMPEPKVNQELVNQRGKYASYR